MCDLERVPHEPDRRPERRRHPRYPCDGYAEIALPIGGLRYRGRIVSLSLCGCLVEAACNLERGTYVEVYFESRHLKFRLAAHVARADAGHLVRLAFEPMSSRREMDIRQLVAELAQAS